MRALGLAIDLEVPLAGVPSSGACVCTRARPDAPHVPLDRVHARHRQEAPSTGAAGTGSDVTNGMVLLSGPDHYDVVEVDVDGGAEKVLDFAFNLARLAVSATPRHRSTPRAATACRRCARPGSRPPAPTAPRAWSARSTAKSNNQAIVSNRSSGALHADDVTRGYRIDVWNSLNGRWHSLCARDGTYEFPERAGDAQVLGRRLHHRRHLAIGRRHLDRSAASRIVVSLGGLEPVRAASRQDGRARRSRPSKRFRAAAANPADATFRLETSFAATKGRCRGCGSAPSTSSAPGRSISPATASPATPCSTTATTCRRSRCRICASSR